MLFCGATTPEMTWLRMRWRQAMKVAGIAAVAYAVVAGAATVRAVDGGRSGAGGTTVRAVAGDEAAGIEAVSVVIAGAAMVGVVVVGAWRLVT